MILFPRNIFIVRVLCHTCVCVSVCHVLCWVRGWPIFNLPRGSQTIFKTVTPVNILASSTQRVFVSSTPAHTWRSGRANSPFRRARGKLPCELTDEVGTCPLPNFLLGCLLLKRVCLHLSLVFILGFFWGFFFLVLFSCRFV